MSKTDQDLQAVKRRVVKIKQEVDEKMVKLEAIKEEMIISSKKTEKLRDQAIALGDEICALCDEGERMAEAKAYQLEFTNKFGNHDRFTDENGLQEYPTRIVIDHLPLAEAIQQHFDHMKRLQTDEEDNG